MSGKPSWGVDNGPVLAAAAVPSTSSRGRALLVVARPSLGSGHEPGGLGRRPPRSGRHRGL